jgi:hypothetical protein
MPVTEIPILQSTRVKYKGNHRYSFRGGEEAEVIGVRMVHTRYGSRPCFMLLYWDGMIDYSPIEDTKNYTLIGDQDALTRQPPIE